jgi:mannose-6-phosphate isomerase-like protein (cupin superfamily)
MLAFTVQNESSFSPLRHVEKIIGEIGGGDVAVASWSPGQISPYHCHPDATEVYFCFSGGGQMRTPDGIVDIRPGGFVVHPPGDVHEYINGPENTVLFRVRYGADMHSRHLDNRGKPGWQQKEEDAAYYRERGITLARQN